MTKTGLDVGCGDKMIAQTQKMFPDVHWVGIDQHDFGRLYPKGTFLRHNLANWLPFQEGEFDQIWCHHVLEHLPPLHPTRQSETAPPSDFLVFVVNEFWRVLKVGGEAHLVVPWIEHTNAWRSPIHYRFFNHETFHWFSWSVMRAEHEESGLWSKWQVLRCEVVDQCHVYGILRKLAWAAGELQQTLGPQAVDWAAEWRNRAKMEGNS